MKIGQLLRFRTRLLKRRNKAQREYSAERPGPYNNARIRLDAEVVTLDKVIDDIDRLVKNNHDLFHDRRKR